MAELGNAIARTGDDEHVNQSLKIDEKRNVVKSVRVQLREEEEAAAAAPTIPTPHGRALSCRAAPLAESLRSRRAPTNRRARRASARPY
ncbi:unnamed protein product [Lampetra planeri]